MAREYPKELPLPNSWRIGPHILQPAVMYHGHDGRALTLVNADYRSDFKSLGATISSQPLVSSVPHYSTRPPYGVFQQIKCDVVIMPPGYINSTSFPVPIRSRF